MLSDKELLVYKNIKEHFENSKEPIYLISFEVDGVSKKELETILEKLNLMDKIVLKACCIQPYIENAY